MWLSHNVSKREIWLSFNVSKRQMWLKHNVSKRQIWLRHNVSKRQIWLSHNVSKRQIWLTHNMSQRQNLVLLKLEPNIYCLYTSLYIGKKSLSHCFFEVITIVLLTSYFFIESNESEIQYLPLKVFLYISLICLNYHYFHIWSLCRYYSQHHQFTSHYDSQLYPYWSLLWCGTWGYSTLWQYSTLWHRLWV